MTSDSLSAPAGQVLTVSFPAGTLLDTLRDRAGGGRLGGFILFRRKKRVLGVLGDKGVTFSAGRSAHG